MTESTEPYFRPVFSQPVLEGPLKLFVECVVRGWSQVPTNRPGVAEMEKNFRSSGITGLLKQSLMERVIKRLETYYNILEKDVADRTALLVLEQKKADGLLREMLPPYVSFPQFICC